MSLRENFNIEYSAYPGNEFPKQCGLGATGHGAYGTYGQGSFPYPKYESGCGCNAKQAPPEVAAVSSCAPPRDACGTTEMFAGGLTAGCAMPQFWGDQACRLPPNHCGSGLCNGENPKSMSATGDFEGKQAGFETYDGQIGDYVGAFAGLGADEVPQRGAGCAAAFDSCDGSTGLQHNPGFDALKCGTPYSAPYAAGPGCGATETEFSDPQLRIYPVNAPIMATGRASSDTVMGMPRMVFNLLLAAAIAFLAYKLLCR